MEIKKTDTTIKDFAGLIMITAIVIIFFTVLNSIFGQGDELVAKMKIEEERIAKQKKTKCAYIKITIRNFSSL